MKKYAALFLAGLMLTGCSGNTATEPTVPETTAAVAAAPVGFSGSMARQEDNAPAYESRFSAETVIELSDGEITVTGNEEAVFLSHDIIYYEDRDSYDSGNPYGEGTEADRHSAEEASAHTVVNITAPGAYRVRGKLSAGQIRVDLGDNAYFDPEAVVELILENADITCTVAPAILFLNTYECDGQWSTETAKAEVDTAAAGANLILEGNNTVYGSHVARIYKDKDGEKKLWKQDGAVYSYMSMNVFGPGALELTADNEGMDTELHLTINGGDIAIRSDNDGINTNEDGVSVTTINGGNVHIIAGLGAEGDGIDSNGYLVINGGTVVSSANPMADAGLDSDLGSYVNGGTVIALGSTMDWAESDSEQVTMNLQFAGMQSSGSAIVVAEADGTVVFAYDPSEDEILGENVRQYRGAVISCPGFAVGDSYHVYLDGQLAGEESGGVYTTVSDYTGGIQMAYSGNTVSRGPGGMGGFGGMGQMPGDFGEFDGEMPEGMENFVPGEMPGDMQMPEGMEFPEGMEIPEGFQPGQQPQGDWEFPEGGDLPEDFDPETMGGGRGQRPEGMEGMTPPEGFEGGMPGMFQEDQTGESSVEFYMSDKVNAFSGVKAV